MKSISWLFFRIRIPEQWEMSKYSLTRPEGTCVFSDAVAERLHISWRRIPRLPENPSRDIRLRLQAVLHDLGRARKKLKFGEIEPIASGWMGFRIAGARAGIIAGRYLTADEDHFLIEAEINTLDAPGAELHGRQAIRTLAPWETGVWCAFNLHFTLAPPWNVASARIYPGSTEIKFHQGDRRLTLYSINPKTTDLTIENMFGRIMEPRERIRQDASSPLPPHPARYIETQCLAARGFIRRLRRQKDYYAYFGWECRNRRNPRIFLVRYRRQTPTPAWPPELTVHCCR